MSRKRILTLDVRPDIKAGREPFSRIMIAVSSLEPGRDLLLIAPFEPVPLYSVLAAQGFSHKTTETSSGDWEVLFSRVEPQDAGSTQKGTRSTPPADPPHTSSAEGQETSRRSGETPQCAAQSACAGGQVIDLDARGLEPPQPLVKILEALSSIPAGGELRARTERRPMHLYAHLEERGFAWETAEQHDGSFITHVRER